MKPEWPLSGCPSPLSPTHFTECGEFLANGKTTRRPTPRRRRRTPTPGNRSKRIAPRRGARTLPGNLGRPFPRGLSPLWGENHSMANHRGVSLRCNPRLLSVIASRSTNVPIGGSQIYSPASKCGQSRRAESRAASGQSAAADTCVRE
jgi:hypothetical protein